MRVSRAQDEIVLEFAEGEAGVLRSLVDQYLEVVGGDIGADPAHARLFPDAYRNDEAAASEFARYTRAGLVDRKAANAAQVSLALDEETVRLSPADAERWLPLLTDRRPARHPRRRRRDPRHARGRGLHLARPPAGVDHRAAGGAVSLALTEEEFEKLVVEELDELPDEMVDGLDNVVFVTEDRPADGSLDLFGLYEGTALTERDRYGFGELPDRIVLYREPLLAACEDLDELRDEIHITLVHEIAHYYGVDDAQLHELGWG